MDILENISLKNHSSLKIGGEANFFTHIKEAKDLTVLYKFSKNKNLPIIALGSGTNTIFEDKKIEKVIAKIEIGGITKVYENSEFANVEVGAGENWDNFVAWSVENDLSGIEALSGIPGTVGASPIQNIGAYGQEVSNNIIWLEIFDLQDGQFYEMSREQCEFGYRDSIFKKNLGRFIIVKVAFQLFKKSPEIPQYKDVQFYFLEKKQKTASLAEIRQAILEIRASKLPWPNEIPNCGSFFKNPIVSTEHFDKLMAKYPKMPNFPIDEKSIKIYAGWLIEECGLKGKKIGKIQIYEKNSLVLTNPDGKADFKNLEKAIEEIKESVSEKFEIELEIEPNIFN